MCQDLESQNYLCAILIIFLYLMLSQFVPASTLILYLYWSTSSPQNLPSKNQTTVSLSTQIRNERTHFNFKVHHSETNSTFFFSRHTMKPLLGFAIAFLLLLHSSLASDIPYPKAISVCSINLFILLFDQSTNGCPFYNPP